MERTQSPSNHIIIENQWNHPRAVSEFFRKLSNATKKKYSDILLDLSNVDKVYPAVCVPVAGTIDYYKNQGINITPMYSQEHFLGKTHFDAPYQVSKHEDSLAYPFAKVWKFSTNSEINKVVDAYLAELRNTDICKLGIIDGLTWSLNETMDNVLQHSLTESGYVMGVIHPNNKCLLFTVFDAGQGIYSSLRNSEYHPRTPMDAISIAIQEGKTRDKAIGQGNGLWGLNNIILKNRGQLTITSQGASLITRKNGEQQKYEHLPYLCYRNPGTIIDFVLNYNHPISIKEALGGYTPLNLQLDNMEDEAGNLVISIVSESSGFGTRIAGERLRNFILNTIYESDGKQQLVLDLSGISIVSSSFADEAIGKLFVTLGFYKFSRLIRLTNMNETVETIINRSIGQRMATEYSLNAVSKDVSDF